MKNVYIALLAGSLFCYVAVAAKMEGSTFIYHKPDGEIRLSAVPGNNQQAKFSINTNVDMHVCEVDGIANAISDTPQHTTLQWRDKEQCLITLTWGQNRVNAKATEECNSYCGMNAGNSLSGVYK
ncbi:hypothetical protein H8I69_15045 [Serratia fonticola]|uniref:hypothetical protein n=1 Tax=Serratia fonticola TaxID=47917 RepID=UPI0015C61B30|nr:hypothetical protein [Serratia fonticola]MBC3380432.1 hypothetical protein [Serratia fonticola]NYA39631.1 hypothetical protein [Serratia fonticola]